MTDPESIRVVSTGTDQVWLVDAASHDDATDQIRDHHDGTENLRLYDEGTLKDALRTFGRDGVELLNQ